MRDLIDRQAAIDAGLRLCGMDTKMELINLCEASIADSEGRAGAILDYIGELEDLPSAQPEQPEIIRCKDCIFGHLYLDVHNETNIDSWVECINPDGLNRDVSCDGYCSAAIRRKNNEDY